MIKAGEGESTGRTYIHFMVVEVLSLLLRLSGVARGRNGIMWS